MTMRFINSKKTWMLSSLFALMMAGSSLMGAETNQQDVKPEIRTSQTQFVQPAKPAAERLKTEVENDGVEYNLYIWINETGLEQNSMMGQTMTAKITATGTSLKENTLASTLLGNNNANVLDGEYENLYKVSLDGSTCEKYMSLYRVDLSADDSFNTNGDSSLLYRSPGHRSPRN